MSGASSIEWTDASWNPIVGCSIVSPGCTNCYAMRMANRIEAMAEHKTSGQGGHYVGTTKKVNGNAVWSGKVALASDAGMTAPLRWRIPRRIFVNSMGDLFHEDIPDEWIDRVFAVMALCPQHTFQILTKRPARMRDYLPGLKERLCINGKLIALDGHSLAPWPLPNVWLGTSCERQQEVDERLPYLINTPAAVRFVSVEPMLGPVLLQHNDLRYGVVHNWLGEGGLNWVIVGGESGPHAREFDMAWVRSLVDQCRAAGVPCFVKQLGARVRGPHANGVNLTRYTFKSTKAGDPSEWPADLRVREMPDRVQG